LRANPAKQERWQGILGGSGTCQENFAGSNEKRAASGGGGSGGGGDGGREGPRDPVAPCALLLAFCLFSFSLTFSFPPFCFRSIIPVRREI